MKEFLIAFLLSLTVIFLVSVSAIRRAQARRPAPPPSTSGTVPATTPTLAPATAPPKNWSWLGWIAVIGLLAGLGWFGMKHLSPPVPTPQPQIQRPQKQEHIVPQEYTTLVRLAEERSTGLTLVGKTAGGDTHFMITNGGRAFLFTNVALENIQGTAYFKSYMSRNFPGFVYLDVNGTRISMFHKGGGRAGIVIGFPALNLTSGRNTFVLSSPGDNIFVEKIEIEVKY